MSAMSHNITVRDPDRETYRGGNADERLCRLLGDAAAVRRAGCRVRS